MIGERGYVLFVSTMLITIISLGCIVSVLETEVGRDERIFELSTYQVIFIALTGCLNGMCWGILFANLHNT